MTRPLFVFGIARSGTNLIGRMLNAHPQVALAFDPLLLLFRHLRDRWVAEDGRPELIALTGPKSPLQDGYGAVNSPALLDLILGGDAGLPLSSEERRSLRAGITARAAIESPPLAAALCEIDGTTYSNFIASVIDVIARTKSERDVSWAGVKEVWTLDFLPSLARAFPDARFLVIERDPRGVLASLEAMAHRDPSQAAHCGSYLRHWRKSVVLARHFERDPALAPKILRLSYEDLAHEPMAGAMRMCDHLGLREPSAMLHPEQDLDPLSGRPWIRNSSFEAEDGRIVSESVDRWRSTLSTAQQRYVSFYVGPEMTLAGYPCDADVEIDGETLGIMLHADRHPGSWRSDAGDMMTDVGLEVLRHQILRSDIDAELTLIRRCFLFDWVPAKLNS